MAGLDLNSDGIATGLKLWPDAGLNNSSLDHHNSGSMKQEYSKIQEGSGQVGPCWLHI